MAARTLAQRKQWDKRCALGTVTGLPRWIESKITELNKRPELSSFTRIELARTARDLIKWLHEAEQEVRKG